MARDAFRARLRALCLSEGSWRRGKEPPDFYLRWDGASYAIEVTRVMDSHAIGARSLPTHGVLAALKGLARDVDERARHAGVLSGTYAMHLAPVPGLKQIRAGIVSAAIAYIGRTAADVAATRHILHRGPAGARISIEKVGPTGTYVGAGMSIGPAKREHTIRSDLARLCGASLINKQARLSRLRLPRVLLLVDSYTYGEADDWRHALGQLDLGAWHTVARVADRGVCQILHSEESRWH